MSQKHGRHSSPSKVAVGVEWEDDLRRVNSNNSAKDLQFNTHAGALAMDKVHHEAHIAPLGSLKKRAGYPKQYRNQEGPAGNTHPTVEKFEMGPNNSHSTVPTKGYELPITTPENPSTFQYDRVPRSEKQVSRPRRPNERADDMGSWCSKPKNDPGKVRAIVRVAEMKPEVSDNEDIEKENVVVGVLSHPPGNTRGYERAPLEPKQRSVRQDSKGFQDDILSRVHSFPGRGLLASKLPTSETRERPLSHPGMSDTGDQEWKALLKKFGSSTSTSTSTLSPRKNPHRHGAIHPKVVPDGDEKDRPAPFEEETPTKGASWSSSSSKKSGHGRRCGSSNRS